MKKKWRKTVREMNMVFDIYPISQTHADLLFSNNIEPAYQSGRYYHNIEHIKYMLDGISHFKLSKEEKVKIKLAIWFHDYVYDSTKDDNEQQSAFIFHSFALGVGLSKNIIDEIIELILATDITKQPTTKLQRIICDLDLRGLASSKYNTNGINIRKEYSHISDEEWDIGRSKFLVFILENQPIYHTKKYQNKYEIKAYINLNTELSLLENEKTQLSK